MSADDIAAEAARRREERERREQEMGKTFSSLLPVDSSASSET